MWEYLQFPEKYRVAKSLGKQRFLSHSNTTASEQKRVAQNMDSVSVLYDIAFDGGDEIMVLYTDISEDLLHKHYNLQNYVVAIAQSVPYDCMIIAHCAGVLKFFIFEERRNFVNAGRSRVLDCYVSHDILFERNDYFNNQFISALRQAITNALNSKDLFSFWKPYFDGECDTFAHTVKLNRMQQAKQRVFDDETGISLKRLEDYSVFDGKPLTPLENADEEAFVDFCCVMCRRLYTPSNTNLNENEWLAEYMLACNKYAVALFKKVLTADIVARIIESFQDEISVRVSWYEYDDDVLREYLWKYFD